MVTIKFEIPNKVATYIKDVLKIEPQTYIQNELVNPIIKKYEIYHKQQKVAQAQTQAEADVAEAKTAMKVTLTGIIDKVQ